MHPGDKSYRNMVLRLTDMFVTEDIVRGLTFENCTLSGPGLMANLGATELRGCTWDAPSFESVAWVLPLGRPHIMGVMGFEDCTFVGCRMLRLGLVVPQADLPQARAGFGV